MDNSFSEEDENGFLDAREVISYTNSEASDTESNSNSHLDNYGVWVRAPESVQERRSSFLRRMGIETNDSSELDRVREDDGDVAVLRSLERFKSEYYSGRSLMSHGSFGNRNPRDRGSPDESDDDDEENNKKKSEPDFGSSPREIARRVKSGWFSRLRSFTCTMEDQVGGDAKKLRPRRAQRVKVKQVNKRSKAISALYTGQEIEAHEGYITTMKFSPDGKFLSSAGEDGVVKIWRVGEEDRWCNEVDAPELDPSCLYFTVNHGSSEVKPLLLFDKEKSRNSRPAAGMKRTSDSACVVFPPKVFRVSEKPLHEFRGHTGEVLDLSWSKNNFLLSSSEDKTVRLWRVGCDHCLKVFSHSNYVTCVQFNPVDDDYFISGSIDGKVRIWGISGSQVVDWTDIREIVTAVCYRPDGQGGIVGSITGACHFYNISDNKLQLDAQICLNSKKKSLCRKITGFQFSPRDLNTVMVTCADSQVRVLRGTSVVGKYRGGRNTGNQTSACFTSDGKHIVSASEDSNVYLFGCLDHQETLPISQAKSVRSCERFSAGASVVVPWTSEPEAATRFPFSSSLEYLSADQEFFLESFPKAALATWPEEKLPTAEKSAVMHKSQLKFLKASCKGTSGGSHAWGMVFVTAGWDGRIRSFHSYGLPIQEK